MENTDLNAQYIQFLVNMGVFSLVETGKYIFHEEVCKVVDPVLLHKIHENMSMEVQFFMNAGLAEMYIDDDGNVWYEFKE